MTRSEHLRWAKDRALEYAAQGDTANAVASLMSDLDKHPETAGHPGIELMVMMAMTGEFERPGRLREFIEGFN
jgi:hypothetical protein